MAAAVAADRPSSVKEEDLPSPSPSPSPSPYRSPSSPVAPSKIPSSPDPDASSPPKPDLASPPMLPCRFLPPHAAPSAGNHLSSSRRLPPPCWTQEETDALIQSYREKWYALRRGNLRASHWEEVAEAVTRRCRHLYATAGGNSPKTAVQCRHKMEKLRKRYRSEKRRPHRTSWVHFRDMDAMEMGTPAAGGPHSVAAASSRSKAAAPAPEPFSDDDNDEDESDDEDENDEDDDDREDGDGDDGMRNFGNAGTRGIHAVMSKAANGISPFGDLRFQIPKAVRTKVVTPRGGDDKVNPLSNAFNSNPYLAGGSNGLFKGFSDRLVRKPSPSVGEEMRKRLEHKRRKEREGAALGEMVAAVRMLGDGFMRVEEMKMEMAREMEKLRMEMELKRTEMILETQSWIVDSFVKGLSHGKKKHKIAPES